MTNKLQIRTFQDLIESARGVKTAAGAKKWWKDQLKYHTTTRSAALGLPATPERARKIVEFNISIIAPRLSQRSRECLLKCVEEIVYS